MCIVYIDQGILSIVKHFSRFYHIVPQNNREHNNVLYIYIGTGTAHTHHHSTPVFFLFNSNCTPKNLFQLVYYISYPLPCLNALCGIKLFKHSIIQDARKGGGGGGHWCYSKFGNQSNCEDNPLPCYPTSSFNMKGKFLSESD